MTKEQKAVVEALERLLAETYTLYLKTQNYHWNVTGPMFTTLHTLFEGQYGELALSIDDIAERIRSLGAPAPATFRRFMELSSIDGNAGIPSAEEMIQTLASDSEVLASSAKCLVDLAAAADDDVSGDLGVRRIEVHQKNAWMLRSHLEVSAQAS